MARGKETKGNRIEGRVVVTGDEGWKTPPSSKREERVMIVSSKQEKDARKLANDLAKSIKVKDIGGPPQGVRIIRDGKVLIYSKDKEQERKIKDNLGKNKDLEVRERKVADPVLVVTGVERGMEDNEFIGKLVRGTEELGNRNLDEFRVIKRITCRNAWKENVVLRVSVNDFKLLVKKRKVEIDCERYHVEEYLGLAMCFKCCRFGHITKYCNNKESCHKCAGDHDGRECEKNERRCVNCWRVFGKNASHSARDQECPAMISILEKSRKRINYTGGH